MKKYSARAVLPALLLPLVALESSAYACTSCFSDKAGGFNGEKIGILTLGGITFLVLFGFAVFFVRLAQRASRGNGVTVHEGDG